MDAQQFLAEFGHIANAPGGVARLREMVLALAVQGRLVEQLESAEPAALQIERIRRIASERPGTSRRKKKNALEANSFLRPTVETLPTGWANIPLCHLVRVINGRAYSKTELLESGTPVLRVGNLFTSNKWYYSNLELEEDKYCDSGDLLYAWSASFGPFIWSGEKVIYHYHIWKLDLFSEKELNKNYLFVYLLEKTQEIKSAGHGISMAHMTKERFEQLSILLPPLEEQSRIVAKVDELMALCDKLEAQQRARRELQNKLRQSILQAVASASSPHELQSSWARLAENFGWLFQAPEDVATLRTLLLELAIQGMLTEQLASDGVASELFHELEKIQSTASHGSRSRRSKQPQEIDYGQLPFPLPKNWGWARLTDLGYFLGGGTPSKSNPDYWQGNIPWVSPKDMKVTYIHSSQDVISRKAVEETSVKLIAPGALLFVVRGMILAHSFPVGMACRELTINQDMKALCPFLPELSEFLLLLLLGSKRRFLNMVERSTHGTCRLETEQFSSCFFGVPPLAEQQRIISRVTEVLRYCDALESQLHSAQRISAYFTRAAIANLIGFSNEKNQASADAQSIEP